MATPKRERREHKRHELACPLAVRREEQAAPARSRSINVSDGGMLLDLPAASVPPPGSQVDLAFSVPRSTPNTFLLEEFATSAHVVWRVPLADGAASHVALRFDQPIDLGLDV